MARYLTLQNLSDTSIVNGDLIGQIGFAASNDSDGGDAIAICSSISVKAEGTFNGSNNPSAIIFATAPNNGPTDRLKVTNEGHFVPIADISYDLGVSGSLHFRDVCLSGIVFNDGTYQTTAFTGGGGGGTTYTAGSGLTLDGTEFNVFGGSGNFQYIELKSSTQDPQIYFLGSGSNDTPITLNILSSYQSASSSGSALVFDGTEGQLFAITDNLSSGVIFSVADIAGLPLIEADASGDVQLIEFGRYVGIGTGTPEHQLDVFGTGRIDRLIYNSSYSPISDEGTASSFTFDLDTSNVFSGTLSAASTLVTSNGDVGQRFLVRLKQGSGGSKTVSSWFNGRVSWPGGSSPTLSSTEGHVDLFGFLVTSGTAPTLYYDGFTIATGIQ